MRARSTPKQIQGDSAEQAACDFLEKQNLVLIARNYRCRAGEIDLIMRDQDVWVFVEVRYRTSHAFGTAVESVNYAKQQRLIRTAHYYLQGKRLAEKVPSRFDIVALQSSINKNLSNGSESCLSAASLASEKRGRYFLTDSGSIKIEWIKNAFEP